MPRLFVLAVTLLMAALIVSVAVAAPGGQGKGKGIGHTAATMTVEGAPFSAFGDEYTVNGSDFRPDQLVFISLASPGCCAGFITVTDGEGNMALTKLTGAPGTYKADAFQYSSNGKLQFMASISFLVTE